MVGASQHDEANDPTRRVQFVLGVSQFLAYVSGALLFILLVINVAQIVVRPVTGGWIWVNDLSRLLIIWVIMVGAAAAIGLREHLVVDLVIERLPGRLRTVTLYLIRGVEILVGVILLVSGFVVATQRMSIPYIQLGAPTGFAYLALPFLGLFMTVFGLLMSIRSPDGHGSLLQEEVDDE